MSTPSRATIESEWANAIECLDFVRRKANTIGYPAGDATNFIGLLNTLQTSYQGDWLDDEEDAAEAMRGLLAGMISPSMAAAIQRPFLRQYLKSVIGRTDLQSDSLMWQEMYRYFQANNRYVQSRAFTFGTPTASGSNVGTTQILRLTRDQYNFPIESGYVDSKRALCIADSNTGTGVGQEVWQIVGQSSARDQLERSGSGLSTIITGKTIDDSLLINAGFRSLTGGTAAAPTGLTGWTFTIGSASSGYTLDTTNYFRAAPSDSTPSALSLTSSVNLTQLLTVRGTSLSTEVPYLLAVIWNRSIGSAAGSMAFRMGAANTAVTLAAQSGWQVTTVPGTMGQGSWYRNFAEQSLDIEIQFTRSSGTLLIGEVLFIPGTAFDGSWYWTIPTSATYSKARVNDSLTWPDIATGSAKNQTWIARAFPGTYLPSSNGSSVGWASV